MYRNKSRSRSRSKPKPWSKPKTRSRSKPKRSRSRTTPSTGGATGKQHCERDEDGIRRCEPESQYEERIATSKGRSRRSPTNSTSSSSIRRRSRSSASSRDRATNPPEKNSSVLKHIVKQARRRRGPRVEMDAGHRRRVAVAKRVDEWLVHQDVAEPLEKFSSLRFQDTGAIQKRFGSQPKTVERDTIATHYDVKFVEDEDEESSSSGDYSSSDGTSASDDDASY